MTEEEWITSTDPEAMRIFLAKRAIVRRRRGARRLRLAGCACCRRVWGLMSDERSRRAVEASEQFADQVLPESELKRIAEGARKAFKKTGSAYRRGDHATAGSAGAASYASSPHFDLNVLSNTMG